MPTTQCGGTPTKPTKAPQTETARKVGFWFPLNPLSNPQKSSVSIPGHPTISTRNTKSGRNSRNPQKTNNGAHFYPEQISRLRPTQPPFLPGTPNQVEIAVTHRKQTTEVISTRNKIAISTPLHQSVLTGNQERAEIALTHSKQTTEAISNREQFQVEGSSRVCPILESAALFEQGTPHPNSGQSKRSAHDRGYLNIVKSVT